MEFHFVCYCHIIVHVGTPMHSHLQVAQSKARIAYIAYASGTEESAASTNRTNTFSSEPMDSFFYSLLISDSELGGKQLWTWPLLKTRSSFDIRQ